MRSMWLIIWPFSVKICLLWQWKANLGSQNTFKGAIFNNMDYAPISKVQPDCSLFCSLSSPFCKTQQKYLILTGPLQAQIDWFNGNLLLLQEEKNYMSLFLLFQVILNIISSGWSQERNNCCLPAVFFSAVFPLNSFRSNKDWASCPVFSQLQMYWDQRYHVELWYSPPLLSYCDIYCGTRDEKQ